MTPDEFKHWLDGKLDGKKSLNETEVADIKAKMSEVVYIRPLPPMYQPVWVNPAPYKVEPYIIGNNTALPPTTM